MKLDKAIKLSPEIEDSLRKHKFINYADAVRLGKEAMTYIVRLRALSLEHRRLHLPGEDSIEDPALSKDRIVPLKTE